MNERHEKNLNIYKYYRNKSDIKTTVGMTLFLSILVVTISYLVQV